MSLEEEIIDTTTEEGKQKLQEMERFQETERVQDVGVGAGKTEGGGAPSTEAYPDPE